jgi:hypothetical protein
MLLLPIFSSLISPSYQDIKWVVSVFSPALQMEWTNGELISASHPQDPFWNIISQICALSPGSNHYQKVTTLSGFGWGKSIFMAFP